MTEGEVFLDHLRGAEAAVWRTLLDLVGTRVDDGSGFKMEVWLRDLEETCGTLRTLAHHMHQDTVPDADDDPERLFSAGELLARAGALSMFVLGVGLYGQARPGEAAPATTLD